MFENYYNVKNEADRIVISHKTLNKVFVMVFAVVLFFYLMILALDYLSTSESTRHSRDDHVGTFVLWLIIVVLYFLGSFLHKYYNSMIFDFQSGYFYYGKFRRNFRELYGNEKYKKIIFPLSEINAIKIVKKEFGEKDEEISHYMCYMTLKNGSRIYLIRHDLEVSGGNLEEMKKFALELSSRLGVKVHDLTESNNA